MTHDEYVERLKELKQEYDRKKKRLDFKFEIEDNPVKACKILIDKIDILNERSSELSSKFIDLERKLEQAKKDTIITERNYCIFLFKSMSFLDRLKFLFNKKVDFNKLKFLKSL